MFALRAVAKATLSSLVLAIISQTMKQQFRCYLGEDGASGRIRTSDRSVRSRVLYPAELRMQNGGEAGIRTPDAAFDRILPWQGSAFSLSATSPHASYECFEELVYRSSSLRGAHITF